MKTAKLTFAEFAGLQNGRIARLYHERASIEVVGDRFVMNGQSGTHSLAIDATDHHRLNAHWTTFASHTDNRYPA